MDLMIYGVPLAGVLALAFALLKTNWVNRQDPGDATMVSIAGLIREGAMAFLAREYKVLAVFVVIVRRCWPSPIWETNPGTALSLPCRSSLERARRVWRASSACVSRPQPTSAPRLQLVTVCRRRSQLRFRAAP